MADLQKLPELPPQARGVGSRVLETLWTRLRVPRALSSPPVGRISMLASVDAIIAVSRRRISDCGRLYSIDQ
jgi:hypothetical protein